MGTSSPVGMSSNLNENTPHTSDLLYRGEYVSWKLGNPPAEVVGLRSSGVGVATVKDDCWNISWKVLLEWLSPKKEDLEAGAMYSRGGRSKSSPRKADSSGKGMLKSVFRPLN